MKKLILILLLLSCGLLYAETRTYHVEDNVFVNFQKEKRALSYSTKTIISILPYEKGYVLKWVSDKDMCTEYFITNGFTFYTHDYVCEPYKDSEWCYIFYECKVIDIKPNEFTVDMKEFAREDG